MIADANETGADVDALPSGTVTFVFTDLEGSTRLWEEHSDAMQAALARHDEILRDVIGAHGGAVVKNDRRRLPRGLRHRAGGGRRDRRAAAGPHR